MKNAFQFIVIIALLFVAGYAIHASFSLTEESKVYRIMEKGRQSFISGSVLPFHGILSEQYNDHLGMDKAMVLRSLAEFFQSTDKRSMRVLQQHINLNQNKAYVDCTISLRMHATKSVGFTRIPLNENRPTELHVLIELDKTEHGWRIVSANAEPSDRTSFR